MAINRVSSNVNTVVMRPGDELSISRKRTVTEKDPETQEETTNHEMQEITSVRCPEDLEITGGSVEGEFDEDHKFVVIRLRCRNIGPG